MCATGQPVSELQDLRNRLMKIRNHLTADGKK